MKKLRLVIRIVTGILLVLTIVGILLLIFTDRNAVDTTYEIIAFSIGAAGMVMAALAQIDSYQNEKQSKKVLEEIALLNREHDEDTKVDQKFQKKLDTLIKMDARIYQKLIKKAKQ